MKKLLLFITAIMLTGMVNAQYALSINGEFLLETDTTITVTEFEDVDGDIEMGFKGTIISNATVYVDITRPAGSVDELCLGVCTTGSKDENQTMTFNLNGKESVFAHYYPAEPGMVTYTYTFRSGEQSACLTVNYVYNPKTAVENVVAPVHSHKLIRNGQVVIVRDGVEYNALGSKL